MGVEFNGKIMLHGLKMGWVEDFLLYLQGMERHSLDLPQAVKNIVGA